MPRGNEPGAGTVRPTAAGQELSVLSVPTVPEEVALLGPVEEAGGEAADRGVLQAVLLGLVVSQRPGDPAVLQRCPLRQLPAAHTAVGDQGRAQTESQRHLSDTPQRNMAWLIFLAA